MSDHQNILRKNRGRLALLLGLTLLSSLLAVASGYSLGWVLDAVNAPEPLRALWQNSLACVLLWVAYLLLLHGLEVYRLSLQRVIKTDLRQLAAQKLSSLSYEQFSAKDSGAYVSWFQNDVDQLYQRAFEQLFSGVEAGMVALFALAVLTWAHWLVGLTSVLLLAFMLLAPKVFEKVSQRAAQQRSQTLEQSLEAYKDSIMGGSLFFLNNLRPKLVERLTAASRRAEGELFRCGRSEARVSSAIGLVNLMSQLVLMMASALAVIVGGAPLGIVLSVGNLSGRFFNGLGSLMKALLALRSAKPLWEKFRREEPVAQPKEALRALTPLRLEQVDFAYGERQVLRGQDLCLEPGGKYALMGESGSGKSTVVKLLLGLLPGYEGRILYGDQEQRQIDLGSLYDQVAYVDQQVYLFQDSLRFNITLGCSYSEEEVLAAVKAAKLEELVAALPQGLDSPILENGKNLSGGQRQRIALARGFIRRARLLILDEGTSALDEENARDIEESLVAQPGLTVLLVTHNLREPLRRRLTALYQLSPCQQAV